MVHVHRALRTNATNYCYHITHSSSSGQGKGEEAMFEVAKTKCSEMGGSLVSIRSEEDQKCIAKYVESMRDLVGIETIGTGGKVNRTNFILPVQTVKLAPK
ncbi:hypothetical protein BV898_13749 [Hypsibius exemplaris]|uniref:C-type lectin domain-containing protein n=1 Tax=Hypsibius exemplaris TaxID=2072580 RepID=A0A1W0W9R0_HYPEX|nr:hypothetical protein BV898_13749 [Hypsibius exemplaris]